MPPSLSLLVSSSNMFVGSINCNVLGGANHAPMNGKSGIRGASTARCRAMDSFPRHYGAFHKKLSKRRLYAPGIGHVKME